MKVIIPFFCICTILCGSCTEKKIYPTTVIVDSTNVDPEIAKFASFLIATWKCSRTAIDDTQNGWIGTDTVNCNYEKQFDFLKQMVISSLYNSATLKVENTYVCSPPRTTYFELRKEVCCKFVITEKDSAGNVVKVYDFRNEYGPSGWSTDFLPGFLTSPNDPAGVTLYCRTFDPSYFKLSNSGSLKKWPSLYAIFLEKK